MNRSCSGRAVPALRDGHVPGAGTMPAVQPSESMAELPLPRHGTLVSWTTRGFLPSVPYPWRSDRPESPEPFGVGLVQLDDVVRVEVAAHRE